MTHALPGYVCAEDGTRADVRTAPWCCPLCGGPWDLDFTPDPAAPLEPLTGPPSLWRYGSALPLPGAYAVTLAEGNTPLVPLTERVHAKLDFLMPTLSFKDRGAVMLAELARRLGPERVVADSSGNAGTAFAAYCARAGLRCEVFVPEGTSPKKTEQMRAHGAAVRVVPGGREAAAAAARAEALVQMLETRASTASEHLGRLRGEAERRAPAEGTAHTELPPELVPEDVDQAQALLRTATAQLGAHTAAVESARAAHADLLRAHRAAEDGAGGFEETAALLRDLLRDHTHHEDEQEPVAHTGSLEEARQSAAEARRSLRACTSDLSAAESAVREASDTLVRHANANRYEQVRTPARQQIRELPASALPEHAAAWAVAFAPRLRVLTDELAQLERNRDSIVDRLRGLVESALATLRSAQRLSQLPEGLGEWSGQEFLRIRFEEPDQATLTERLGEVIDDATRAAVKKNSTASFGEGRRDGMSLLLHGVQAALEPKGIAVEILKPDAVLRAERVPVGQMGDVFSGGQLLTAAIALYCTMAALRSNDRGRDKQRHAGTLFLDNPIGRANATYLLELQRAVSDALGVQLLYTTGLFDTTALAEFPLVIRLRNDADLRAGLKYISVEEHLRPGLPHQSPDEETIHGEITATRMFRRGAPA
ncbi:pyridoxal-phosphate dependent enzyme [Streptomyces sp. ISL-66]|uniref:pyridoxal-phosphate dependent enzyme n=1 Tax=Streptomyces sp. ISL-66 TaxID=2819186 RepID=UPI001BE99298|nr:pyridoxal-phosphate dependent enzyme [Streptomyces sp. ISL-66]MBT2469241.1 pyridoxal-phosphate dependent enzyme [Streptomyces sp. ISL-66]